MSVAALSLAAGAFAPGGAVAAEKVAADANGVDPKVEVRTTGDNSERVETLPVTRRRGAKKRVVMSMTPKRLPSLANGDRLELSSELQVTPDCRSENETCVAQPYVYSPTVVAKLILATGRRTTGGRNAVAVSERKRIRCPHNFKNFVHHCRIVFRDAALRIERGALPCSPGDCHVNFVLSAHSRRADAGDKLLVGANTPHGNVRQDRGRLNAIRFHPGAQRRPPALTTRRRVHRRVSLREERTVVLSKRLPGLKRNAQLSATSRLRIDVSHLPYDSRFSLRLILASRRTGTSTPPYIEREASLGGELSEQSGSNCTQRRTPCRYLSAGVLRMRLDATAKGGEPAPRFVNLVVVANPKFATPRSGDRVKVLAGSRLSVVRFPPEARG